MTDTSTPGLTIDVTYQRGGHTYRMQVHIDEGTVQLPEALSQRLFRIVDQVLAATHVITTQTRERIPLPQWQPLVMSHPERVAGMSDEEWSRHAAAWEASQ